MKIIRDFALASKSWGATCHPVSMPRKLISDGISAEEAGLWGRRPIQTMTTTYASQTAQEAVNHGFGSNRPFKTCAHVTKSQQDNGEAPINNGVLQLRLNYYSAEPSGRRINRNIVKLSVGIITKIIAQGICKHTSSQGMSLGDELGDEHGVAMGNVL